MKPVVTEQTAKKYKATRAIGGLLILFGFFGFGLSPYAPLVALPLGIVVYLHGRLGAWWNHR